MDLAQILGYLVGLPLEVLVVDAMRRGEAYRRYPFVFLYVIVDFITTVVEIQPGLEFKTGTAAAIHRYTAIYWTNQWIMQALVFLLVIGLLYRASARIGPRRTILLGLIGATLLFAAISLAACYRPGLSTGRWMTPWTRDLNFCAAILDLVLWAILIHSKEKDYRLLMVSGALGVQFAGRAMGESLREISRATVPLTGILILLANLACTYIWWQAFRSPPMPKNIYPKDRTA